MGSESPLPGALGASFGGAFESILEELSLFFAWIALSIVGALVLVVFGFLYSLAGFSHYTTAVLMASFIEALPGAGVVLHGARAVSLIVVARRASKAQGMGVSRWEPTALLRSSDRDLLVQAAAAALLVALMVRA